MARRDGRRGYGDAGRADDADGRRLARANDAGANGLRVAGKPTTQPSLTIRRRARRTPAHDRNPKSPTHRGDDRDTERELDGHDADHENTPDAPARQRRMGRNTRGHDGRRATRSQRALGSSTRRSLGGCTPAGMQARVAQNDARHDSPRNHAATRRRPVGANLSGHPGPTTRAPRPRRAPTLVGTLRG